MGIRLTREELRILFMDHGGEVASIIENHVQGLAVGEALDGLVNTPLILLLRLALPGEDGDASSGDARNTMNTGSAVDNESVTYAAAA